MLRGDWFKVGALGLVAAVTAALWALLSPSIPVLPAYQANQSQAATYQAGGAKCAAQSLARLAGAKALAEKDRCAEAAEQHRLQHNDLVQQTRAADAAQAGALIGYDVARMTLAGVILGFLTVVAAALAAFYARRAYLEAEKSLAHQERATRLQLQPFVYWKEAVCEIQEMENAVYVSFDIKMFNAGATPAFNFTWAVKARLRDENGIEIRTDVDRKGGPAVVPPGGHRRILGICKLTPEEWAGVKSYRDEITVELDGIFDSRFAIGKRIREHRAASGADVAKGDFYILSDDPNDPVIPNLLPQEASVEGQEGQ